MYFSNIANAELQHFHQTIGVDFSMSLTEILSSDLFKKETIIPNRLYKVYPLFYCKEIISNNSVDKILDNRCLILEKKENHETYLSFITDANNNSIKFYQNGLNFKDIGESLSVDEYNAFVYQLRQNGRLNGNLNFENNTNIQGSYGSYVFQNIADQLRNDAGLIINEQIKNNPITVKLINPFFINAKYVLTFTVRSLTGVNVCEEGSENFVSVDSFDVVLVEDSDVIVDVSNYVNDSVLDFDVTVNIDFDVAEIVNLDFDLELSADKSFVPFGSDLTLTATLIGEENVQGYIVSFYEDGNLISTQTTDENGEATYTFTPATIGNHVYACESFGLNSNINIEVNRYTTELQLSSSKSTAFIPTSFVITGVLTNSLGAVSNAIIKLYNNNSEIVTAEPIRTDNDGTFSYEITANTNATYNIQAVFETSGYNNGCNSNIVNVTARKLNTTLTLNVNRSTVYYTQNCEISGVLKDELGNPIPNARLTVGSRSIATTSYGTFNFTETYTEYNTSHTYQATYNGDDSHNSSISASKTVTYQKAPVNISILNPKSEYTGGDTVLIKASSNYGTYNPTTLTIQNRAGYVADITTKDSDGNFVWTVPYSFATNTYNMHFRVDEQTNYQAKGYETTMYIVNNPVDTITLSKSGNNLIINCKKNNANVPNLSLEGGRLYLVQYSSEVALSNTHVTDSNGNVNYGAIATGMGAVYVTFAGVTSNTITF